MGTDDVSRPSPQPPPVPPREACNCADVDPTKLSSAWEEMATLRGAPGGDTSPSGAAATGGLTAGTNGRSVRIIPSETLDLRIFCGTWNVAGRTMGHGDDLGQWLDVDTLDDQGEDGRPPDMFAVGFQEVVDLNAQNVVFDRIQDTQSRANSLKWFTLVYAFLYQYGQRRMLGVYLLVMAADHVSSRIRHVQSAVVPTGLGGFFNNKGAVAVRLEVAGSSSLCFICAHMTAHRENVAARNAEYKYLSSKPVFADTSGRLAGGTGKAQDAMPGRGAATEKGASEAVPSSRNMEVRKAIRAAMAFGLPRNGVNDGARGDTGNDGSRRGSGLEGSEDAFLSAAAAEEMHEAVRMSKEEAGLEGLPKTRTVLQADVVFWMGDLNYRIAEDVPDEDVFDLLLKDDLESLRNKDQLNLARASGAAFEEFQEGPLCFPPTYKYIPGTRDFDQRPEKKIRCPSWTDRILYSVGIYGGDSVRRLALDKYWSDGPLFSDHIAVSALFRTSLVCAPRESIAEPDITAEPLSPGRAAAAAAFEAAPFPKLELEPAALVLREEGSLTASATAEIRNVGGVSGTFHVCDDATPAWISLEGSGRGTLGPGETVDLSVVVDVAAAAAAAVDDAAGARKSQDRPDACAVLRIEADGGGDGCGVLLPVVCMFGHR